MKRGDCQLLINHVNVVKSNLKSKTKIKKKMDIKDNFKINADANTVYSGISTPEGIQGSGFKIVK